jgi:hypothetical protein
MSWTITSIKKILFWTIGGCPIDVLDFFCHHTILFQTICGCPIDVLDFCCHHTILLQAIYGCAIDVLDHDHHHQSCSRPFVDVLGYYCNNMILLQTIYCIPGIMSLTILGFAVVDSVFTEGLGLLNTSFMYSACHHLFTG